MNAATTSSKSANILLVEDNPVDVLVTKNALEDGGFNFKLHVTEDGEDALDYLCRNCNSRGASSNCPDLILLDINLPKKNGKEVLAEIRDHSSTLHIPVVILTTSNDEKDVRECYSLHANCYIIKPVSVENFTKAIQTIGGFWTKVAKLPPKDGSSS